jgi:polar amino acid transport system substrate-binding protein
MKRPLALIAVLLAACTTPPVDPEGTLDRVRAEGMRVGVTESDPWATLGGGEPSGVEVEIVERLAAELETNVEWVGGSEEELFGALKHGELDLVIGGLGSRNAFAVEVALTHPYLTTQVVVAVPSSEEIPEDIAGVDVAVEEASEAAGILRKTDARVVLVADVAAVEGPRAIDDWLLDDLDLVDTGLTLVETDHVMAVRMGENGWMVTIEKFLLDNATEIQEILDAEGD